MRLRAVEALARVGPVQRQARHHARQQPHAQQELVLVVRLQQRRAHPEQGRQDRQLVVLYVQSDQLQFLG